MALASPFYIPSPPVNGFHIGPAYIHFYGLMYVIGITVAIIITQRRWKAVGGDPGLVGDVAIWAVPAGIIGGRIYFDLTTPKYIPHHWYGVLAVWDGGLGIWGGIALAAVVGVWRVHRSGASAYLFMDAVAPALLVAQAIGRVGNYFNQELFGGPTTLPWALQISPQFRPAGYAQYTTFHPTFLYEFIFDLAWAAVLVWLGHHRAGQAARAVRAVRRGLLGVPHLRGVAPGRSVRALPRPAAEHVRGQRADRGRHRVVHQVAAPRPPRRGTARPPAGQLGRRDPGRGEPGRGEYCARADHGLGQARRRHAQPGGIQR